MNHILHTCHCMLEFKLVSHYTQQNKESTRVWDGGKGECLCIFLVFLTIKAKYAPIHIMVFHAHISWHRKKTNKTKLNMYKVKEK